MRKRLLLFLFLLFADVCLLTFLKERTSLQELRDAGVPVKEMKEAGMSQEDMRLFLSFWKDLKFFPLGVHEDDREMPFDFTDTWMQERSYGGKRKHEGCDIFGKRMLSGYYPVVSMTDGRIENVGWLPLGGWRIGVKSPGGGYFYYAHLSGYAREFKTGETVRAGELLGFLGDTGYGEAGTTGKFAPHLHLGIYVQKGKQEEYALNPYPMLFAMKEFTKKINY